MARTGSGKTACFLLPMFERLKARSAQTGARALVLSPTRELALQTMKFTKEVGPSSRWLRGWGAQAWAPAAPLTLSLCLHSWANSPASRRP